MYSVDADSLAADDLVLTTTPKEAIEHYHIPRERTRSISQMKPADLACRQFKVRNKMLRDESIGDAGPTVLLKLN